MCRSPAALLTKSHSGPARAADIDIEVEDAGLSSASECAQSQGDGRDENKIAVPC